MMVSWSAVIRSALMGSGVILLVMYFLLPALGLPKLDFTSVTSGWVGATGRNARLFGIAVFVVGGVVWAYLFARFWPIHGAIGGLLFGLVPFAVAMATVLPDLFKVHITLYPVPGFMWVKVGGPNAVLANL
ncbi:MAG TPA: hypothetical protein VK191_09445, partial [Symbiobacteriaceae bacterium]|nr:hypothetical protein [Symbiobacteriaceae bacterium]